MRDVLIDVHHDVTPRAMSASRQRRAALAVAVAVVLASGAGASLALSALPERASVPVRGLAAAGDRWSPVIDGLYGDVVLDVLLAGRPPQTARSMLLLPAERGVHRIDDVSAGWYPVQANPDRPRAPVLAVALAGDDANGHMVYAAMQGRQHFARSEDEGRSWVAMTGPAGTDRIDRLASITPAGTLYAAQSDASALWRSVDHGDTWQQHSLPGPAEIVNDLFAAPDDPVVYVVRGGELWRSVDDPATWARVLGPTVVAPVTATLMVSHAAVGARGRVFAAGRDGTSHVVRASIDRGASWISSGYPSEAMDVPAAAIAAGDVRPGVVGVWLAVADGRVFESGDGGAGWALVGTLPIRPTRIVVDSVNGDVWVGSDGLGLYRLKPEPVIHTGAVPVHALAVEAPAYEDDGRVVLLARVRPERREVLGTTSPPLYALYASSGGEHAWAREAMTEGLGEALHASPDFTSTRRLYSGRLLSDDAGLTWRALGAAPSGEPPHVAAIGPISGTQPVMYALERPYADGAGGSGLVLSEDGGNVWQSTDTAQAGIVSVVVSPGFAGDRMALFVTDRGQVYRTRDGLTFTAVGRIPSAAPLGRVVYDVEISPDFASDGTLVAVVDDPADAAQRARTFVSGTRGETWQARNTGLVTSSHPRALALSPHFRSDRLLFIGGSRLETEPELPTIYASDSAGAEWYIEAWFAPSAVLDFGWVGTTAAGRLFAAVGSAGLWVRDLSLPVGLPPATRTPTPRPATATSVTTPDPTTDTPTPTMTATDEATATPVQTEAATGTAESPTPSDDPTASPAASASPTPSITPTSSATPDTPIAPRRELFVPFAARP